MGFNMKIIECEQGTPEWLHARLGLPTASQFHRVITPKNLKPSSQGSAYAYELVAERLLGAPLESGSSEWMERGKHWEEQAVTYYEFEQDVDTTAVGFATTDDGLVGCSPDRLVGEKGGLEVKVPGAGKQVAHLHNLEAFEAEYRCQVQGCIYVCEREWWDLLSYSPSPAIPSVIVRCYRDDAFQKALAEALKPLTEMIQEVEQEMRALLDNAA